MKEFQMILIRMTTFKVFFVVLRGLLVRDYIESEVDSLDGTVGRRPQEAQV